MARFSDEWISELLNKNDIVDVVAQYVSLKENGGRYWGLCPFHHEKTPSFSVSRERQLFYCFGCKEGGNVIHFVMKTDKLPYYEAVEMLANRVNMSMPSFNDDTAYEERKRLSEKIYAINREAAHYYHQCLISTEGKLALEYLKKRGVGMPVIKRFGLGYATAEWESLYRYLLDKGYSVSDMKAAWLVKEKEKRAYDMFRNRIMFPIINVFGKVIAFGGRVIDPADTPKYMNSSDTAVFNKRKNLYAINALKEEKGLKYAVLVEGYMDAISLLAHGQKGVVASLGTSLTNEQAQLIKRYTSNVFIAYDGDFAGQNAALKASDILIKAGLNAKVIVFEQDMDPDDFIRAQGLKGMNEKMVQARSVTDFKLDILKKGYDLKDEDQRAEYAQEASKIVSQVESAVQRERYTARLNKETGFSVESLKAQAGEPDKENIPVKYRNNSIKSAGGETAESKTESLLLLYVMKNPQLALIAEKELDEEDFADPFCKKIFYMIFEKVKKGILPVYAEILSLITEPDEIKRANELFLNTVIDKNVDEMFVGCMNRVKIASLERKKQQLMVRMKNCSKEEEKQLKIEIFAIGNDIYKRSENK
jgi:DNA primase